jgi:MFS family permease
VAALISYPSGFLSDKLGRKTILLLAFAIFLVTYLGFALTRSILLIALLFILYGLFQGIFRSVGKAFATDFVPEPFRAGGVGTYAMTVGLSGLVASVIAGQLWDNVSHSAVFLYGAFFAVIGGIALLWLIPSEYKKPNV